jgi:hypothetical protein
MKRNSSKATVAKSLRGKKTWPEKLADDKDLPKVVKLEGSAVQRYGGATLAILARSRDCGANSCQRIRINPVGMAGTITSPGS